MSQLATRDDRKQSQRTIPMKSSRKRDKEFKDAVERVFRKYGSDLSAFLREIQRQKELLKKG